MASKRHQRYILRRRNQRQSWYHLRTASGTDQTARLVFSRRPRPGMRFGDIHPPHHLDGDDERVGGDRKAAHRGRLACPAQEVCDYAARFGSGCWILVCARSEKELGGTTSGRPTGRTETSEIQRIQTPSRFWHHKFRAGNRQIFLAITKYMDDLPEKTLIEAQGLVNGKSCTVSAATDPPDTAEHLHQWCDA